MATPKMVFVDTSLCTGCRACSVACKAWNELPPEKTQLITSFQTQKDYTYDTWTYISFHEKYENGKMDWFMFKHQCYHCEDPSCMKACPSEAIYKTDSGYTLIDHEKCIGCGYCATNCPWGVPMVNPQLQKSFKCTGCIDRVENGMEPACVATCQPGALSFGEKADMQKLAKERLAEVKKTYPKAQLYGDNIMGGTTYLYLLLDEPKVYGVPAKPATPISLTLWKDLVHPLGGIAVGAAALAITGGVLANFARGNYRKKAEDNDDINAGQ
ncbi:MAG: 4Fe-4S dicluster domain-containing protein [Syntrophomonadaceae bacterium]|nr:4Fe-4S dicluster domain-containing protein [Syntrophomonadaceae bacterium]